MRYKIIREKKEEKEQENLKKEQENLKKEQEDLKKINHRVQ